jgi:hypothetical protein
MSGFLDPTYGVNEARRSRRIKLIAVWSVSILIVASVLYFTFRNWRQEQVVKQFLSLLKQQNYQEAYKLWGCTQETPCKYYPPDRFNEDWGPSGQYKDAGSAKIDNEDVCGSGVIFTLDIPKIEPFGLWVERSTNIVGFAPNGWARCPGAHFHFWEFLKSRFSS